MSSAGTPPSRWRRASSARSIATGVAVGASGDRNGYADAAAAQMANQMLQLHYSRDDESQADEFGMRYMAQAGYDPHEMLGVMNVLKKLEADTPGGTPEMLRTHPLATTRIERVQSLLNQNDYAASGHLTKGAPLQNGVPAGARLNTTESKVRCCCARREPSGSAVGTERPATESLGSLLARESAAVCSTTRP